MEDKDNIRVDLLKFRRKAYLSYPEGSLERKTFLKVILQNELRLTEQDIPHDFINFLVDGDKVVLWNTLQKFLGWLGATIFCTYMFLYWHSLFSPFFLIPGGICATQSFLQIKQYYNYRKSLSTIKKYSNDMKKYMNRISNDIKRLDGPHGF